MRLGDSHAAWRNAVHTIQGAICAPVRDCRWPVVIPTQRGFPASSKVWSLPVLLALEFKVLSHTTFAHAAQVGAISQMGLAQTRW